MKGKITDYLKYFTSGTKTMFKEFFNKETNKKQRANMWTFARLLCTIPTIVMGSIAVAKASIPLMCVSAGIAGFGGFTDLMDGRSARKYGSSTEFGKRLDQLVDKLFAMPLLIFLASVNPIFLLTLIGEGAISVVNLYYLKKYDIKASSNMIGKIKQFPLFIGIGVGFFASVIPGLSNVNLLINTITNLCQGVALAEYSYQGNKEACKIKKSRNKSNNLVLIDDIDCNQNDQTIKTKEMNDTKKNTLSNNELKNSLIQEKNNLLNQTYEKVNQKQYKNENYFE